MKYYSEDDVMDLIREAEDCERAYEWGKGHMRIHFEDYHPIEIPDKHGRIIDAGPLEELYDNLEADNGIYMEDAGETLQRILDAPTVLEASNG